MPATAVKPPCTHREAHPIVECGKCGAYLRTGNKSTWCDPCGTPEWETDVDLGTALAAASIFSDARRPIFDALLECMEAA